MNARPKYPSAEFRLPRGRLVRGSLTKLQTTDHKNQPLPPNKHNYWIAIAVEKTTPGAGDIVNGIIGHAWNTYQMVAGAGTPNPPTGVFAQMSMGLAAPSFAWKIDDGDLDPKWSQRDGCKGCWIIQMSTTFPIPCFDPSNASLDPAAFNLGDYVDAFIEVVINGETGATAGVFVNPRGVRWLGQGQRITTGRDAATMFGAPVGGAYTPPPPASPPMSQQMTGHMQQPGQAGPAPGGYVQQPPAPPPPPPPPPPPAAPDAATVAAQYGVPHHPGWRWNPAMGQYEADVPPAAPNGYANGPGAVGGAPQMGAPSVAHGSPQATAYPSNYGPGNPPPGVQPQHGFAGGQPPRVG
jgi:hypothetical protein